jgi:hypothetical protein
MYENVIQNTINININTQNNFIIIIKIKFNWIIVEINVYLIISK